MTPKRSSARSRQARASSRPVMWRRSSQALLAVLQGGQDEDVGALVETRLPEPDAVHDAVPEGQLRHPGSSW